MELKFKIGDVVAIEGDNNCRTWTIISIDETRPEPYYAEFHNPQTGEKSRSWYQVGLMEDSSRALTPLEQLL